LKYCSWIFKSDYLTLGTGKTKISNAFLIHQPKGLCFDSFACAFNYCSIRDADLDNPLLKKINTGLEDKSFEDPDLAYLKSNLNLPKMLSLPRGVGDVYQAVKYAINKNLKISVKSTGHSFTGSATLKGSVNINFRDFPKYTSYGNSVIFCGDDKAPKNSENVCALALARNKTAAIRVSAGQTWGEVFYGVESWNRLNGKRYAHKYEVVGGGGMTVSAIGGWLQGGGLGRGNDRLYGIGVDQVLEIEMILSNGEHVKFGPTEWSTKEKMLYPQTTKIEGYCNNHIVNDESLWKWSKCKNNIPFEDLWQAVRGGGGGTYGLVLAMHIQLHPERLSNVINLNYQLISRYAKIFNASIASTYGSNLPNATLIEKFVYVYRSYIVDFLYFPSKLGIDDSTSWACGSPGSYFSLTCKADGPSDMFLNVWRTQVAKRLKENGLPKWIYANPVTVYDIQYHSFVVKGPNNPVSRKVSVSETERLNVATFPVGLPNESPLPQITSLLSFTWAAYIPIQYIKDYNTNPTSYLAISRAVNGHILGGAIQFASDGMDSIPESARISAFQQNFYVSSNETRAIRQTLQIFLKNYFNVNSSTTYIADTEWNHISSEIYGPTKKNFKIPCSSNLSFEEKLEKCISIPEASFGTVIYNKLENFKKQIDPNYIFCNYPSIGWETCNPNK